MELIRQILFIVVVFYAILLTFLFFMQKRLLFFPTQARHDLEGRNVEPYVLERQGAVLRGWLLNTRFAGRQLIIYYGGNAEDIYYAREQFAAAGDSAVLLVNYRGYGGSTGSPGEAELMADALAVYDDILRRHSPAVVLLMGRSLGSAVAVHTASRRRCDGVILVTPFDSIEQLARKMYPFVPVSLFLRHRFRSIDHAGAIEAPLLVIYGGRDRIVPPRHTENLIRHLRAPTQVVHIEAAEHNNIELFDEYQLALLTFIEESAKESPAGRREEPESP